MSRHPLARLLGDGVIAGLTTWAAWRFLLKPLGKGISHLGYRWRRFLTPLWLSLGIEITAIIWHWLAPWYWWLALALPVFGGTAAALGPRLSQGWTRLALVLVPESLDGGRKGVLDRVPERIYSAAALSYLGLWLALRVGAGASPLTTYGFWVGVIGFGGTWWWHRRIRTAGIADRYARSWKTLANPETGPIRELHGSRVVDARGRGRNVAYLTVRLKGGLTVADLSNRLDQLCSFWSLRRGAITLSEDETNARRAYLQILRGDPWRGNIPHPLPEPGTVSLLGLGETLPLGLLANGEEERMRTRHLQIIGKNGSGKSVMLEDLMIWFSACTDVQMVGADMASGATFAMWEPTFLMPVAIDYEQTLELLARVVAEIEYREAKLGVDKASGQAHDSIVISPDQPALFCLVDELPKFVSHCQMLGAKGKKGLHLLNVIGQQGRKVRVWLVACAQNGSKANMATKELQAQMSTISFYLSEHASRVLWGADHRQGWSSSGLKVGQGLLQDDEHTEPNVFKAVFATKAQRLAHIRKAAALPRPAGICPGLFADVAEAEPVTVVDAPDTGTPERDETEKVIIAVLCSAPQAHWKELAERAGVAKPTLYRRLNKLCREGEIHSIGKGNYRIGRDPDLMNVA